MVLVLTVGSAGAAPPELRWLDQWDDGEVWQDAGRHILADGSGHTYITGYSSTPAEGRDIIVLRYAPDGRLLWDRRYVGSGGFHDEPFDAVLADNGDLLIAAHASGDGFLNIALLRYDTAGTLVWEKLSPISGAGAGTAKPQLDLDAAGRIVISGTTDGDYLAQLHDAEGSLLWQRTWNDPDNAINIATDIAIDAAGNVIVTGYDGASHPRPYRTVAWDVGGEILWHETQTGDISAAHGPAQIAITPDGHYILNAAPESSCGQLQTRTWKLDDRGQRIWDRSFPENPCTSSEPAAFTLDGHGNILISSFSPFPSILGFATIKYDAGGTLQWDELFHQRDNSVDRPASIATDHLGCVYIAGVTTVTNPPQIDEDLTVVKYSPHGQLIWSIILDDDSASRAFDLALGDAGAVFVLGRSDVNGGMNSVLVARYDQPYSPADLTGEGEVNITDLLILLSNWGPGRWSESCIADLDDSGTVDVFDLLTLLSMWG